MAVRAFVALGSNLGDSRKNVEDALRRLASLEGVRLVQASSVLQTKAVGGPVGQPDFQNAVAELELESESETARDARALLVRLQQIELEFGRERAKEVRFGPRTLDLDLLLFGELRMDEPRLMLPHPRMEEREFVLEPLAQLAPDLRLLESGRSVRAALAHCESASRLHTTDSGMSSKSTNIELLHSPQSASPWCAKVRAQGKSLGFVPTMGALHAGHLSLVERALRENDVVCVSVFVNPLQFDDAGDLEHYPRNLARDAQLLDSTGCDMVFTGTLTEFFQGELDAAGHLPAKRWLAPGSGAEGLEGACRTGHFEGVATIVDRLFDVVAPGRAYFGQKDFQQCLVVRELAARRGGPEIVVCPISREASGLARSSRNERLDAGGRELAICLSRALRTAALEWTRGERNAARLEAAMSRELELPGVEPEYVAVRELERWSAARPERPLEHAVALVAARIGPVRLIDNHILAETWPGSPSVASQASRRSTTS